MADSPFESIESAREYLGLLDRQLEDVRAAIREDIDEAVRDRATRRGDALRLVDYKLKQLADHLRAARRIMNDLQMLRRLLVGAQNAVEPISRPGEGTAPPRKPGAVTPEFRGRLIGRVGRVGD